MDPILLKVLIALAADSNGKAVGKAPEKYSHIDFKPPEGAAKAAARGLEMRRQYKRGGTPVGIQRAKQLKNRQTISPSTARRMYRFFLRHEKNKDSVKPNGDPGNGKIAWLLWGGDPGYSWARKLWKQMKAVDK
jgi:hypothetical protein